MRQILNWKGKKTSEFNGICIEKEKWDWCDISNTG